MGIPSVSLQRWLKQKMQDYPLSSLITKSVAFLMQNSSIWQENFIQYEVISPSNKKPECANLCLK